MLASLDLTIPCAIVNTIGAFACLFLMQALTGDCGLKTKVQRIKLLHRLSFVALAAALIYNAGVTIDDDSAPRLVDFLVQIASLPVITFSAWRHHIGNREQALYGMGMQQTSSCHAPQTACAERSQVSSWREQSQAVRSQMEKTQ